MKREERNVREVFCARDASRRTHTRTRMRARAARDDSVVHNHDRTTTSSPILLFRSRVVGVSSRRAGRREGQKRYNNFE